MTMINDQIQRTRIHDTETCDTENGQPCSMCQWADKQERLETSDDEAILNDIDQVVTEFNYSGTYYKLEAVRAAIFDVLDGGDGITPATARRVGFRNDWRFDPEDESEAETERRMRFVDAVIARLEKP